MTKTISWHLGWIITHMRGWSNCRAVQCAAWRRGGGASQALISCIFDDQSCLMMLNHLIANSCISQGRPASAQGQWACAAAWRGAIFSLKPIKRLGYIMTLLLLEIPLLFNYVLWQRQPSSFSLMSQNTTCFWVIMFVELCTVGNKTKHSAQMFDAWKVLLDSFRFL